MDSIDNMIGYCGYDCGSCAARSDDPAVRQRLVDGWRKIFGHQHYDAENVRCDGCRSNGRLADKQCQARPCAHEKGVDSCAQCGEFLCDKVRQLVASREGMLIFLHRAMKDVTKEEYELCVRQFESMPNLIKVLVKEGKLQRWADPPGHI